MLSVGDVLEPDVGRERHVHFLHLGALAALEPPDVLRRHAVLVLEQPANPHRRRHVVLRHPHALAAEVLGLADAGLVADEDRRVAEHLRREDRDGDHRLAAAAPYRVGRERELARVELEEAAHPIEDLFRAQRQDVQVDALGLHGPGLERAGAVVITDGERERE